ncbi:serine hydrolase domain-containing protein [soil metagenome]
MARAAAMSDERFSEAADVLRAGVEAHAFPAACVEVGRHDGAIWNASFGGLTFDPLAPFATDGTIFDLASLTKVLATATLAMRALDTGRLALSDPLSRWFRDWSGRDRQDVTIRELLTHSSGLSAYLAFYRDHTGRPEFERAICTLPLEYAPGTRSVYSDLGFILLGFILEDAYAGDATPARKRTPGAFDPAASLHEEFRRIAPYLTSEPLQFMPPRAWRPLCAPTERDPWRGRLLTGEVHDGNGWALGGAAGHAGLFGTSGAVGAFARAILRTLRGEPILADPRTMRAFATRSGVPGSSRALAWDTMLPTSSCGTRMSASAIGHTGFTGTSLWIDWERDLYVVLLTNRVHPTPGNNAIRAIRRQVHDAVVAGSET